MKKDAEQNAYVLWSFSTTEVSLNPFEAGLLPGELEVSRDQKQTVKKSTDDGLHTYQTLTWRSVVSAEMT